MDSRRGNTSAHLHAHGHWHDERRRVDRPEKFLPKLFHNRNLVIADIGCGRGYYAQHLIGYSSLLYCVDIDREALADVENRLKDSGKRARFLVSTSAVPTGSVDVILYANSFHDIENKNKASKEAARVLKPDGMIIVVDWKKGVLTPFGPPQNIRMSEADYLERFPGFKILKKFRPSPYHFGLVLGRKETEAGPKKGLSKSEISAMKEYLKELNDSKDPADRERAVSKAIEAMPEPDRTLGKRLNAIIRAAAPSLLPRLWYGMPAYAEGDDIVCFFQPASKFKVRYMTLGFSDRAKLDEGSMWPVTFAVTKLTAAEEAKITALLKKAVNR